MQTIDVIKWAFEIASSRCGARTPILGISGAQGIGKSWLARAAAQALPDAIHLSLDDFYLTPAARRSLGASLHPLFATRGVPGTHDLGLLNATLDQLLSAGPDTSTLIPAFNKLMDEPTAIETWRAFKGRPNAIVFDGWCLGALPQNSAELRKPVNALERDEDSDETWRRAVNTYLEGDYAKLFARLDSISFLKAPSFDIVHAWRCQQEEEALGRALTDLESQRINRFIAFFERLTRSMLAGNLRSDITVTLDDARRVLSTSGSAL